MYSRMPFRNLRDARNLDWELDDGEARNSEPEMIRADNGNNETESNNQAEEAGMEENISGIEALDLTATATQILELDEEARKLLACPVCNKPIFPPITLCRHAHILCTHCKKAHRTCPTCSKSDISMRNRFWEKMLNFCLVKCKYTDLGCDVILPGRQLTEEHHPSCKFSLFQCLKCDEEFSVELFLEHVTVVDGWKMEVAKKLNFIFDITDEEPFNLATNAEGVRTMNHWKPAWLHCYNTDFFCFMVHSPPNWWIWVGALASKEVCDGFRCSILVRNKGSRTEVKYVGTVHPIRTPAQDIFKSGQCLNLFDINLKNLLDQGGIEVDLRIYDEYKPPVNCLGAFVNPPLTHPLNEQLDPAH